MNPRTRTWWLADAQTGALSPGRGTLDAMLARSQPVLLNERGLESLIALNPQLVGADGHVPLLLHGGQSCVDQVYGDALERKIVVEIKKGTAKKADLIQLLGYVHHMHFEPPFIETDDEHLGLDVVAVTRPLLRQLVEIALGKDKHETRAPILAQIDAKLPKGMTVAALGARARKRLDLTPGSKKKHPPLRMAPRMVLVARDFDDECLELTNALNRRWLDVTLVALRMFTRSGETTVTREIVRELSSMKALHRLVGALWQHDVVAKRYVPDGWYFATKENTASFSFSGCAPSQATFWLEADPAGALRLQTRVPHATFTKAHAERFSAALQKQLPRGSVNLRGDWTWTHAPDDTKGCIARALEVAKVSDAVLGTAALQRAGASS